MRSKYHFYKKNAHFLLFLMSLLFIGIVSPQETHAQTSFVFTAGGDHGAPGQSDTLKSLQAIKNSGAVFHLALGDMSYEDSGAEPRDGTTPSPWCSGTDPTKNIKLTVGETFPFQLIVGNHEDDDKVDGFIENFKLCLPDRMNSQGLYGVEYFFDYPQSSPLVRVIAIGAGTKHNGISYTYTKGSSRYNWLSSTIDASRSANIPWVVVAMHKNCITVGSKPCEIGRDLLNLLVEKKVDLVLQGHDHDYQRSKQLLHNPSTCTVVTEGTVDPDCISDDGSDNFYTKGQGPIFTIAGMFGGGGFTTVNTSDSERDYFSKVMGANGGFDLVRNTSVPGAGRGLLKFTVSRERIDAQLVISEQTVTGELFSDSYTIASSGSVTQPPTATQGPTSTPTPTKTPSPSPTIGTCLPGDANNDCKVDGVDYIVWLNNYNLTVTGGATKGDYNGSGKVDGVDYIIWLNNYGSTTSTVTPTVSSNPAFQPTAPYYATFFYPWSENPNTDSRWSYWNDSGNNPPNTWFSHYIPDPNPNAFDPATELYSSNNDAILNWQMTKLKEAKLEVAISSWWGQTHKTNTAFRKIITDYMNRPENPYPNLRWALYYENEGFGDPSEAQITSDLNYIASNYASQPGMLKINGKPVMFVYGGIEDTATSGYHTRWANANNAATNRFYIVLKVYSGYASVTPQPDSWHQYAPAVRSDSQLPYSYMVSPGFWLDDGSAVRLGRDLNAFRSAVSSMVNANATWKLVETWNEWGEGTSVEPGEQVRLNTSTGKEEVDQNGAPFKNLYVDALHELLPPLE